MPYIEAVRLFVEHWHFVLVDEARCKSPWLLSPLRDLMEHERIGHTCGKHIGKSLEELRERMVNESKPEVSSFWSIDAAKAAICFLTMEKIDEVIRWIIGGDGRITLEGLVPTRSCIGYVVTVDGIRWSNGVRMTLRRLSSSDIFGIITAYPIC